MSVKNIPSGDHLISRINSYMDNKNLVVSRISTRKILTYSALLFALHFNDPNTIIFIS
jgi:hypothetical protein